MSYFDSLIAHYDMSTPSPVNLAPNTYGELNGVGTGIDFTNIVDGVGGKGTKYNGSEELTTIQHTIKIDLSITNFTLGIWSQITDSGFGLMFKKAASSTPGIGIGIWFYIQSNHWVYGYIDDNITPFYLYTNKEYNDGVFHHFCLSIDRNNILNSFIAVDGNIEVQGRGGSAPSKSIDNGDPLVLNEGLITVADTAMIFNKNLTQIQARDLHEQIRQGKF